MSVSLTLARPEHLPVLLPLVADMHAHLGLEMTEEARRAALLPLLEGVPQGAVYLIGPARAPIGYAVLAFGWSIELGGMDGFLDELYVRPAVRGRGIATEVLLELPRALAGAGLKALHVEVDREDAQVQRICRKTGFRPRERFMLMTRTF